MSPEKLESMPADGLTLYYDPRDRQAARLMQQACQRSAALIHEFWGLETPADCRVYLMTSWQRFMFHAAPWAWRPVLALSLPFWAFYARRLWRCAGGWVQGFGRRRAVGIKHPVLIQGGDSSLGDRFFVREHNLDMKFQQLVCHELTHAFTWQLKLPPWLNEGLAMVTVDRYCGKATVRRETLEFLAQPPPTSRRNRDKRIDTENHEAIAYQYVRGYWLTGYLEETAPGLLKQLLTDRRPGGNIEREIAAALGKDPLDFWTEIDRVVACFYQGKSDQLSSTIPA
ncbi:MAG: hypothetical protein JXA78_14795 [Anaerolineales bacterium]|nr:hypothetical protein [Anaerolineales bacterium]